MAQKRDTRTAITSAVIGALLATLVLFTIYYFAGRSETPVVLPSAETGK